VAVKQIALGAALFAPCAAVCAQQAAVPAAAPIITTTSALGGAQMVNLASNKSDAAIYYTVDGSVPQLAAMGNTQRYEAPFLVTSRLTVRAIAASPGLPTSTVASKTFTRDIPAGTLVWSDEFTNSAKSPAQPDPAIWIFEAGSNGWGNGEMEDYCAWGSASTPCSAAAPNGYVGTDGALHIVARQASPGSYTSARLKTQGLFSYQYGRLEVRARLPEGQGLWPAIWSLGNGLNTVGWPATGELDTMEHINAPSPDWVQGSVHGTAFTGEKLGRQFFFPAGTSAADWHTYGMIWSKGSISFYVDDPGKPYAHYTPDCVKGISGAVWPFDVPGAAQFLILNLAIGGGWPGSPNATTRFPAEMVVDYVRVYAN